MFHSTRREEGGNERWSSFILGTVMELDKQHGCIWTSEDRREQHYPPPNLQALLKLVLVPRIDSMSVQAFVSIPMIYEHALRPFLFYSVKDMYSI